MSSTDLDDLCALEDEGWRALSTGGDPAAFHSEVLAGEAVVLFPGGLVLSDRAEMIATMADPERSAEYRLDDPRVIQAPSGPTPHP